MAALGRNELVAQTRSVRLYTVGEHRAIGSRSCRAESSPRRRGESGRRALVGLEYSPEVLVGDVDHVDLGDLLAAVLIEIDHSESMRGKLGVVRHFLGAHLATA